MDVARACGFSVSTVSIVLSEAPLSQNVAEKTRQDIRAMAQKLGYHPDASARSLRRRRVQPHSGGGAEEEGDENGKHRPAQNQ